MAQGSGTVASVWRYPVKSMAGQQLPMGEVTTRGLLGDRAYALVDAEDEKVATAKNPRKWPQLFEFAAALEDGAPPETLKITLPDGTEVSSTDQDAEAVLSRALGRDVRLQTVQPGDVPVVDSATGNPWKARSEEYWPDLDFLDLRDTVTDFDLPEGTFFDCAVLHVLTTATLARLGELYPEGQMATRRFRPNLVVDTGDDSSGFVENDWVGRTVRLGDEVKLAVTGPCPRCVMITLPQGDLPKDSGILRTVARNNGNHVGVYASVVTGGRVRAGDAVVVE
jgi:uncharacterized protein YcbX